MSCNSGVPNLSTSIFLFLKQSSTHHISTYDWPWIMHIFMLKLTIWLQWLKHNLFLQDDILQALSVTDEDRSIARDALDLQTFSEYAHDIHFSWVVTVSLLALTPLPQVWHCYCWLTSMMTATFSSRKLHEIRVTRRKGKKYREKKTWFDVTICCNNGLVSMSYKKYHCICTWAEW